ncbi:MAG: DUF2934 domain-containing protein [Vicinamibacterales bacterium]
MPTSDAPASAAPAARRRTASPASRGERARRSAPEHLDQAADTSWASPPAALTSLGPTHAEIAEAAYFRYLRRNGQDGSALEDWVAAEVELRGRS